MARLKIAAFSIVALTVLLGGFFVAYDREAEQSRERARIEAERATTDYQQAYARQLARCGW